MDYGCAIPFRIPDSVWCLLTQTFQFQTLVRKHSQLVFRNEVQSVLDKFKNFDEVSDLSCHTQCLGKQFVECCFTKLFQSPPLKRGKGKDY